jgi:sortase A
MLKNLNDFFLKISPKLFLVIGVLLVLLTYYQTIFQEVGYYYNYFIGKHFKVAVVRNVSTIKPELVSKINTDPSATTIRPVDTNFGIVIEKINVNAPVVKDVPIIDPQSYLESLKLGVAHASFSGYPNEQNSNVYLFAHSSNNFWELGKYSSVFNLIYKLDIKDQVSIFYEGKRYIYEVENKLLVNDFKVDDTVYEYFGPTLTLQTCYPTGTSLYRLIVRATLVGVYDYSN